MRLFCTSASGLSSVVQAPRGRLISLVAHRACHQPLLYRTAQLHVQMSLSLSSVLNCLPCTWLPHVRYHHYRIVSVSAVPGHSQLVLSNLITDRERGIFSPVPQTTSTANLCKATSCRRHIAIWCCRKWLPQLWEWRCPVVWDGRPCPVPASSCRCLSLIQTHHDMLSMVGQTTTYLRWPSSVSGSNRWWWVAGLRQWGQHSEQYSWCFLVLSHEV